MLPQIPRTSCKARCWTCWSFQFVLHPQPLRNWQWVVKQWIYEHVIPTEWLKMLGRVLKELCINKRPKQHWTETIKWRRVGQMFHTVDIKLLQKTFNSSCWCLMWSYILVNCSVNECWFSFRGKYDYIVISVVGCLLSPKAVSMQCYLWQLAERDSVNSCLCALGSTIKWTVCRPSYAIN